MTPVVAQDTVARWPDAAIGDTVSAIVQSAAYQRSTTDTIWLRIMRWLGDMLRLVYEFFAGSSGGRTIVIALFSLLVLVAIIRLLIGYRDNRDLAGSSRSRSRRSAGLDHLRRAEQLAESGDYTAAAHALCAGLLSACAARGEVRLHSSKTTGDYAREMKRKGTQSAAGFQAFRSRYDPVVYRDATVSETEYRALSKAALPLISLERAA